MNLTGDGFFFRTIDMEKRTSVLLAIQITSKADKEFSSLSLPFQSELGVS